MRIILSLNGLSSSSECVMEAPDSTQPSVMLESLAAHTGNRDATVDVPVKSGLVLDDGQTALRFGVKVGVGVSTEPAQVPSGLCLVVVAGPATGAIFELPQGDHVIGRAGDIALRDQALSRRHACLSISPDGDLSIEDLKSANGTFVEGVKVIDGSAAVRVGDAIALGETVVEVCRITLDAAAIEAGEPGWINFVRPPRITSGHLVSPVAFPEKPSEAAKRPFPLLSMLVPLLIGGVMAYMMHSPRYLLFMLASPIMMIGNLIVDRRSGGKQAREDAATYADRLSQAEESLRSELTSERRHLREETPDAASAYLAAVVPGRRLWERRAKDSDFLTLRLGTTTIASAVKVSGRDDQPRACDVPVSVDLRKHRVVGVAGPIEAADKVLAWLVIQLAVWHAPRDVQLSFLSLDANPNWAWLQWLPQMRDDESIDSPLARLACGEQAMGSCVSWLQEIIKARQAVAGTNSVFQPHIVVIRNYRSVRLTPGLAQVLQDGPAVGVYAICSDEQDRALPEECEAVFRFRDTESAVGVLARQGQAPALDVISEQVSPQWCDVVARELAPLHDIGTEDHSSSLPNASRLFDVLELDQIDGAKVAAGWAGGGRSTKAVIGELADGLFSVDIRSDGPHGLVAGTTGSGKSELLQTLVAALSIANRPDEMNFVLIDYKGGAAFKDCARLPHTVGTVTDLDGHLTTRALESLGAELRRREHQLASLGAKDIEDYQVAMTADDPPMPRLMIIIDEFAALVQELPDFVAGLVDIARRGRSLGVHLLLATQRPAGVVSAEIKSNTNLRIALRVTDATDSSDVIESPEAAHIAKSTPGRAYARLGHSALIAFQSSRVGGRPAGAVSESIAIRPIAMADLFKAMPRAQAEEDASVPTDLARLVDACRDAAALTGIKTPPSPWLEALPDSISLDELFDQFPQTNEMVGRLAVPIGITDIPSQQARDVAAFDIASCVNLAVVGAGRSGRSSLLRTIAMVIAQHMSPQDVQLYAIDAGGNALLPLALLPHTGAVVSRDQAERIGRLTRLLKSIIAERQQKLASEGFANLDEQRSAVPEVQRLPYILVMLDAWEVFYQTYESVDSGALVQAVTQIAQEGPGVGISCIFTGDRSLLTGRLANLFPDRLMLRVTDTSDYSYIGMPLRNAPSKVVNGRGFSSNGLTETQVALVDPDPSGQAQVTALQAAARAAQTRWQTLPTATKPKRVDVLPIKFNLSQIGQLPRVADGPHMLPVVVGGDTLSLYGLDAMEHGPGLLVAGPRRSGRSSILKLLALFALRKGWSVWGLTMRASALKTLPPDHNLIGVTDGNTAERARVEAELAALRDCGQPSLVLIDDMERIANDGWLSGALESHLDAIRDTGSALVGAATASEMGGYRGIMSVLKKTHSGVMLSPQVPGDCEAFGATLPRSVIGLTLPAGAGYLVWSGAAMQAQVVFPDGPVPD